MKNNRRTIAPDMDNIMLLLIGAWRRFNKLAGPPDRLQTREFRSVVAAVKALQERSIEGRSLIGQNYFEQPELLGAYLLYQWVLHYQEGLSLIGELPEAPRRVLDVCSGPAPLAFAALRHGAQDVVAVDQSATALKIGAEVAGRYGMPLSIRQWDCQRGRLPVDGEFDLIMVGHCLDELFPATQKNWEEGQHLFLRKLMDRLTPQGHLLLVDNSFAEANTRLLRIRDLMVKGGVPVQAPCVWKGECPALKAKNSPCYAQREFEKPFLIKEIQRANAINLSSLKMTYVIFRNPKAGWPVLDSDKKMYRVISPPIDSFGGKRFYLCGTDGKKQLSSHLAEHPPESRAFEFLRRGELISFSNAMENDLAIDIVQDTAVHVEAACGKPLPELEKFNNSIDDDNKK